MSCGEARKKDAHSIKNPGGYGYLSRAYFPHPQAAHERGKTEHQNAQRKCERHLSDRPPEGLGQRNTEYAPGVHCSECNLHDHARYGNTPPIGQGAFS